ncbi:MAG: MATE family efflux transporter [Jaaginema sp. PMC 1079.18]|nr:MATE family efflux transporter [Jaaginema sp. PMC 1080.18]MEC4850571.1 MATE family efflux transporter [Jaaginema sp. PMC 1079.18]MEC4866692.1 MATE family efflux transporter [Jaaginema sp. PMC 1078.18]
MKTSVPQDRRNSLTEGSVSQQLIHLTIPMIWGVFAVIAFNLVDTFFVGQLGTKPLAAMSFTFPVVSALGSVALGLGVGASSVIARAIGEGDRDRVQRLTTDSLGLSVVIVGVFVVLGLLTINPLFKILGAEDETLVLVKQYMYIWYPAMIFLVIPMVGNSAIRAAGNTKIPSLIMTVAAAINIILDPILIFGWGSIPELGLKGAAIATAISRATTLVASLWFLHFREKMLCFRLPSLAVLMASWRSILFIGLPAAGTNLVTPISIGIITSLLAVYGAETVAGFGIASRVESFALIVILALSATIGPFVGQNWGAGKIERIHRALNLSFLFSLAWGAFLAIILAFFSQAIASLFDSNPGVVRIAVLYLVLVPFSYTAWGIVIVATAAFNALGKPLPAVIMTLTRMLILYVPIAYLGSIWFGVMGIFAAAAIANVLVGVGAYGWVKKSCIPTEKKS